MIRINFIDADKWITVHPNGRNNTGAPVLVGSGGEIKGGMGGKFNGQKIGEINKPQKGDTGNSSAAGTPVERLDHGELSIPNRTKNINRDLDRHKAEQAKQQRRDLDDRKFLHEESQRQKAKTLNQGMSEADKKSFHKELTDRLTKKSSQRKD